MEPPLLLSHWLEKHANLRGALASSVLSKLAELDAVTVNDVRILQSLPVWRTAFTPLTVLKLERALNETQTDFATGSRPESALSGSGRTTATMAHAAIPTKHGAPMTRSHVTPCHGTSPSGHHWLYVQPQHTGSQAVVDYLRDALNETSCGHGHYTAAELPAALLNNVTFVFSFVANPFRRVLSNAAWHHTFGYGSAGRTPERPSLQQVLDFNERLARSRSAHGGEEYASRGFPIDWSRCKPHLATTMCWDVLPQTRMLSGYRALHFVGCTESLTSHLREVLRLLGYGDRHVELSKHCHSELCETHRGSQQTTSRPHNESASLQWYGDAAEATVRRAFLDDFVTFNFSIRAREMFDAPSGCRPLGRAESSTK